MTSAALAIDASHDFDFLIGTWKVAHRKLRKRLAGNDEWDEFASTLRARHLPGGLGNIDEMDLPDGVTGMAIRLFDPRQQLWSIHWVASNNPVMDPAPVIGRFNGSVGEFFADDTFDGRSIRVRYTWMVLAKDRARWAQAFSPDAGASWETNWVMEFTRQSA
jgi:hypothetical protein